MAYRRRSPAWVAASIPRHKDDPMYLNDPEVNRLAMLAGIDPENAAMMRGYLTGVRIAHDLSEEQWAALTPAQVAERCAALQPRQETSFDPAALLDQLTGGICNAADEAGSNEEHICDLEELLGEAWAVMTPAQQRLVAESPVGRKALSNAVAD